MDPGQQYHKCPEEPDSDATPEETQPLLAPLPLSLLPRQAVTFFPAVSQTQSSEEIFVILTLPAGAITAQLTAPKCTELGSSYSHSQPVLVNPIVFS
jgi:hypothetical protein